MPRYVAIHRPKSMDYWDEGPLLEGQTVHVDDDDPVDTGLLDASGMKLYRLPDKIKPGFYK